MDSDSGPARIGSAGRCESGQPTGMDSDSGPAWIRRRAGMNPVSRPVWIRTAAWRGFG